MEELRNTEKHQSKRKIHSSGYLERNIFTSICILADFLVYVCLYNFIKDYMCYTCRLKYAYRIQLCFRDLSMLIN